MKASKLLCKPFIGYQCDKQINKSNKGVSCQRAYLLSMMCKFIMVKLGEAQINEKERNLGVVENL